MLKMNLCSIEDFNKGTVFKNFVSLKSFKQISSILREIKYLKMVFSCWGDREEEHEGSGVEFIWRGSPGESRGRAENSWWSKENEKRQDISKTSEVFFFYTIKFRFNLAL